MLSNPFSRRARGQTRDTVTTDPFSSATDEDAAIEDRKAARKRDLASLAGGERRLTEIAEFAETGFLPEPQKSELREEKKKLDAALETGPIDSAIEPLRRMAHRYAEALGPKAAPPEQPDPLTTTHLPYLNETQLTADMRRPGYQADAPKRAGTDRKTPPPDQDAAKMLHAAIQRKLRKSSLFGQPPLEPIEPAPEPRRADPRPDAAPRRREPSDAAAAPDAEAAVSQAARALLEGQRRAAAEIAQGGGLDGTRVARDADPDVRADAPAGAGTERRSPPRFSPAPRPADAPSAPPNVLGRLATGAARAAGPIAAAAATLRPDETAREATDRYDIGDGVTLELGYGGPTRHWLRVRSGQAGVTVPARTRDRADGGVDLELKGAPETGPALRITPDREVEILAPDLFSGGAEAVRRRLGRLGRIAAPPAPGRERIDIPGGLSLDRPAFAAERAATMLRGGADGLQPIAELREVPRHSLHGGEHRAYVIPGAEDLGPVISETPDGDWKVLRPGLFRGADAPETIQERISHRLALEGDKPFRLVDIAPGTLEGVPTICTTPNCARRTWWSSVRSFSPMAEAVRHRTGAATKCEVLLKTNRDRLWFQA